MLEQPRKQSKIMKGMAERLMRNHGESRPRKRHTLPYSSPMWPKMKASVSIMRGTATERRLGKARPSKLTRASRE